VDCLQYNTSTAIVVNQIGAFLVDRDKCIAFKTAPSRTFPEFHPQLALLVVYARKNNLMESMATVAINALKLSTTVNA